MVVPMYKKYVGSYGQYVGMHVSSNNWLQGNLRYGRMSQRKGVKWYITVMHYKNMKVVLNPHVFAVCTHKNMRVVFDT